MRNVIIIMLMLTSFSLSAQQEIVQYGWGKFVHNSGDNWQEVNNDGKHPFKETSRTDNKITLKKTTDNWTFIIDLNSDKVFANGNFWSDIKSHNIILEKEDNNRPISPAPITPIEFTPNAHSNEAEEGESVSSIADFATKMVDCIKGLSQFKEDGKFAIKNITLRNLIKEIGNQSQVKEIQNLESSIPSFILDAFEIKSCSARMSPLNKKVELRLNASIMEEEIYLTGVLIKGEDGIQFVLGAAGLTWLDIVKLIGGDAGDGVKEMEKFVELESGFAISTAKKPTSLRSIPLFRIHPIEKGITLLGQATIKFDNIFEECNIENQQTKDMLKRIMGDTKLYLKTEIPEKTGRATIEAGVGLNLKVPSPTDPSWDLLTFNKMKVKMKVIPGNSVMAVGGNVSLHIKGDKAKDNTTLNFYGDMTMKPENSSVGLDFRFNGVNDLDASRGWVSPFGIPGIEIHELSLTGSMESVIPWVSGGVRGKVSLGTTDDIKKKITGGVALKVDPNSPQSCLIDLSINELSLAKLMDAFPVVDIPEDSEFRKGLNTGFKNNKLYVVPTYMSFLGKDYEQGINLNTEADIFGWNAKYSMELNPDPLNFKYYLLGEMDPLEAKISISGKDVSVFKMKGNRNPGPKIEIKAKMGEFPEATLDGDFTFLKLGNNDPLLTGKGLVVFNKNEMVLKGNANLFGLYEADINLTADKYTDLENAAFIASAHLKSDHDFRKRLTQELLKNAQKGVNDAEKLKKATTDSNKPFEKSALDLYVELKKGENALADAAAYILYEGFSINELSLVAKVNNERSSIKGVFDVIVSGKRIKKDFTLEATNLEVEKMIEELALEMMKELESQGKQLISQIQNTNTEVWDELSNVFEVPFSLPYYTVELDYKAWGMQDGGVNSVSPGFEPVTVILKDANKNEIGRVTSSEIPVTWRSPESSYYGFSQQIKRIRPVKYVEVINKNIDMLFVDDVIVKLGGKTIFKADDKDKKGWALGMGAVPEAWRKDYTYSNEIVPKQSKEFMVTDEQEYILAFHYREKGEGKITATFYDTDGYVIESNVKLGYSKPLAGWQEFAPIKTNKTIGKVKIHNKDQPYTIDLIRMHQSGVQIFEKGVRGKHKNNWKGTFDFTVK